MGQLHPTAQGKPTFRKPVTHIDGPTLDEIDYDNLDEIKEWRTHLLRTEQLRIARLHVLRDAISICYKQHSVNHAAKCKPLYIEYLRRLEEAGRMKINIEELHPSGGEQEGAHKEEGQAKAEE